MSATIVHRSASRLPGNCRAVPTAAQRAPDDTAELLVAIEQALDLPAICAALVAREVVVVLGGQGNPPPSRALPSLMLALVLQDAIAKAGIRSLVVRWEAGRILVAALGR